MTTTDKSPKMRKGRWYARENGDIRGPAEFDKADKEYPWCIDGHWYSDAGKSCLGVAFHLVREVPSPTANPPKPARAKRTVRWVVEVQCPSRSAARELAALIRAYNLGAIGVKDGAVSVKDNGK